MTTTKTTKKQPTTAKKTTAKKSSPAKKAAGKAEPTKKRKVNYLNNKDMLAEVITSKEAGRMTDKLAHMLQTLAARYGRKGNWSSYTYNDDMQAYAMYMLVRTWDNFNPEKSNNPFAFFTQCIKNSFIQYLKQEKRQRDIRDAQLVNQGLTPSYTYQMEQAAADHERRESEGYDAIGGDEGERRTVDYDNDIDADYNSDMLSY